jgi:hypothetical protein
MKAKELKQKTIIGFSGTAFATLLQPRLNKLLFVCVVDWYCSPAFFMLSTQKAITCGVVGLNRKENCY